MSHIFIQKLTSSGYKIEDVNELIMLFMQNLYSIREGLNEKHNKSSKDLIHKLKGGLKILQLTEELAAMELLEKKIIRDGIKVHINSVNQFIKEYINILEKNLTYIKDI